TSETRRAARDAVYRFATTMAGDAPGYKAALRALFAADLQGFARATEAWPEDIRDHARRLAPPAFGLASSPLDGVVPLDSRHDVQTALEAAFPGAEVPAAEPVAGGASRARVIRLTVGGEQRLLKLEGPRDALRDPA